MNQKIYTHTFENGLTLLAEPMGWLESAAAALLTPAGCIRDPANQLGLANFTCEMAQRGCGDRNSRQFVEALEELGVDSSGSVSLNFTSYGGAMPAESLPAALGIFADIVRRPHLPAEQLEDARLTCFNEIRGVEDDFSQRVMQELRLLKYGHPQGRSSQGEMLAVQSITLEDIQQYVKNFYSPQNAILSVAGKIEWEPLLDRVAELFGDWKSGELPPIPDQPSANDYAHQSEDSSQTHIAVAYDSVPYSHEDYFQARGAVGVLSDGMSSRLFTEVREKRGLCYTVYATLHSLLKSGSIFCYSGTSTERAQETLNVMVAELIRLHEGILPEELDRLKVRIKSGLIMQQESSASRAASMAGDWFHLGRVRTMAEVGEKVDALTCETINKYLKKNPPRGFAVATLGADELTLPKW